MYRTSDEQFERIVGDAIDSIPQRFLDELDNVMFTIEDDSPDDGSGEGPLLGLYDGYSLLERDDYYGGLEMPDTITIFKKPHEEICETEEELRELVRETVVHEVGHYFGMDEDAIERMGYA